MLKKQKYCKSCGTELVNGKCPNCSGGKSKGNFFKRHKILTAIIVLLILGGMFGGNDDSNDEVLTDNTTSKVESSSDTTSNESQTEEQLVEEEEETEEEVKTYPEGMYKVGTDIEEGLYLAIADGFGYYEVATDSTGELDSIITNDNFEANRYIKIEDGEYIKVTRASLVRAKEVDLDMSNSENLKNGMYKVGKDIEAGEYKVKSLGDFGYVEVSKNARGEIDSIVTNDNFEGEMYITVKDNQYLKLSNAELILNK